MISVSSTIDLSRAKLLDKPQFEPFYVRKLRPLVEAIRAGNAGEGTALLVTVCEGGAIALDAAHMSYHHVAQGELAGDPWLVTY